MLTFKHLNIVLDTVVLLASFASFGLNHRRYICKQPSFVLGMLTVALCLTANISHTIQHTAFVSAAAALVMLSAVYPRDSNLSACLHLMRALRLAWQPNPLALAPAALSVALHLAIGWDLSSKALKQTVLYHIRGIFALDGFKLFFWLGKHQEPTVSDIHDPACEKVYREEVQAIEFNPAQSEKFDYCILNNKIEELCGSIKLLIQIISDALAEILNVWIVASRIGWRFLIPMLLVFAHESLSYAVNAKINRLEKQSKTKITPKIRNNFHNMARNIRSIKFYAWERAFLDVRTDLDKQAFVPPLFWRVARLFTEIVGSAVSQIASAIAIMSSIQASGISSYAEVALLIDSIASLTIFSFTVSTVGTTYINVKKSLASLDKLTTSKDDRYAELIPVPNARPVNLSDCVFSWGSHNFAVHCSSLSIEAGEFVTVVGRIGSGKSSLLLGMCGEMPLISGQSHLYGRVGYVAQKPPIFDTTFRNNVIMENEYDEEWFATVVDACALTEDIQQLEKGDQTLVGFGGINLSGGQKARLALARALYRKADVYIFDDLLSAVDAHVERHIVKHVLAADGIIGTKTRILVTHAEHVVPLSDKVVTLTDGMVQVRKQTAVPFADMAADTSQIIAGSDSGDSDAKAEPFAIHPEYENPPFYKEYLWKFISLCGYWNVAGMVAVQLASAYAKFYVGGLRISLMADNNPDTIVQSLRHYLLMNALAGILNRQLMVWSSWIESKTLSQPLMEKLRCSILDTILTLPLTTAEDMSYSRFREAPAVIESANLPANWPTDGEIEFQNYSMRYRPNNELVLKNLSFSIGRREKIGVVGRTGAGKSSLTHALMRMVEPDSGRIIIDGIDISTIGLYDLRSRIGIIPQDPALFFGSIRDNLDPMNEYSDDEVWTAIRAAKIEYLLEKPTEKYIENPEDDGEANGIWLEGTGLEKWVKYDGRNFSVGERQLVSLCRALLWKRQILILDEATANVDNKTDQIMQAVLRQEFKDCTVLTIAHRLDTIMDCDKILVMDQGTVAEFDTPQRLLAQDGHFSRLLESMRLNQEQ
ncbi:ATP-binding cassette glutathione S-conjugate transporter ycf1 [Coemansia brasiliensis]|uniref:ATP-binding cassette glutathione S-conjugate transporter ycf1 n=1 Tax=Coemansia brasiliensis TaxID=2650707 RepID=A0A9W8IB43_9FUNG|nr:ATP-binding cassette glutathione S-conjugate transporter ycf1 [Coemansia brasiliensis]